MRRQLLGLLLMTVLLTSLANGADANSVDRWEFDVYLDQKMVGSHLFQIIETNGVRQVQSEAQFRVTFLKIPVYRYDHSSEERWQGDCLVDISATTNANGKRSEILGAQEREGFKLDVGDDSTQLPECVMTFAYWNPSFLDEPKLLNPQTGEYLEVSVERAGNEELQVRGEAVVAKRIAVKANGVDVNLWYSSDNEWLALESVVKGGRVLRYELS